MASALSRGVRREDGKEAWRFNTVAGPGDPDASWGGDSWKTGGGSIWVTGSYDPETNLTMGASATPASTATPTRGRATTCTASVVALDADTGRLKWHYQFSPHDEFDQDAVQVPVLPTSGGAIASEEVLFWAKQWILLRARPRERSSCRAGRSFG